MENDHPLLMNAHHHTHQSDINHLPLKWPPQSCHWLTWHVEHPYGAKFFQGTHDLKTPEIIQSEKTGGIRTLGVQQKMGIVTGGEGWDPSAWAPRFQYANVGFCVWDSLQKKKKCQNPGMVTFYCVESSRSRGRSKLSKLKRFHDKWRCSSFRHFRHTGPPSH